MDETAQLTKLRNQLNEVWFNSLKIGDKVYNYAYKWQNKEIIDKKLREGIIKEIHDNGEFNRYVIVDNLTTGRQNKWGDYELVKPQEIQDVKNKLTALLQEQSDRFRHEQQRQQMEHVKTIDEYAAQAAYEQLVEYAQELLKNSDIALGKCAGIYGAFSKNSGECVYIGKSKSQINKRWSEHKRFWKKLRPVHRQPLLTQYIHFFGDQIEWRVLLPIEHDTDNDLVEFCERRLFEKYRPIANSIVPNGTYYGRSVLEGEGDSISVSEWNPAMVIIRIRKGNFDGFSDGKDHFIYERSA